MVQYRFIVRGYSSEVERHLAKVHVARSNRVTRCQEKENHNNVFGIVRGFWAKARG